jgi:hypothetical protein
MHRCTLRSTPLLFEPDYSGHVPKRAFCSTSDVSLFRPVFPCARFFLTGSPARCKCSFCSLFYSGTHPVPFSIVAARFSEGTGSSSDCCSLWFWWTFSFWFWSAFSCSVPEFIVICVGWSWYDSWVAGSKDSSIPGSNCSFMVIFQTRPPDIQWNACKDINQFSIWFLSTISHEVLLTSTCISVVVPNLVPRADSLSIARRCWPC